MSFARRRFALLLALLFAALGAIVFVPRGERSPTADVPEQGGPTAAAQRASRRRPKADEGVAGDPEAASSLLPPTADHTDLAADRDVYGDVLTRTGDPVAGAVVQAVHYPWRRTEVANYEGYREERLGPQTRAAEDGSFRLRLRPGDHVGLRASSPGFATEEVPHVQAGECVHVVLGVGVRVAVTVKDAAGAPVPDVELRLARARGARTSTFHLHGITGAEGGFAFEGVPGGGDAWLEPRHATLGYLGWQRISLPAEGDLAFDVVLRPGRTITGNVFDADTGAPIVAARIGMSWMLGGAVETDEEGHYALHGWIGRGVRKLHVRADGYGHDAAVVGERSTVDFRLRRGDTLTGRIVDPAAASVEGALVSAIAVEMRAGEKTSSTGWARSAADGRFEIAGLRHDLPHTLVVVADGLGRLLLDFDPAPKAGGVIDLGDIALGSGRTIAGQVLTANCEPVPRVRVTLTGANADQARLRGDHPPLEGDLGRREQRLTADLGQFRFPHLLPGTYRLRASLEGSPPLEHVVELAPGADVMDVVLRPEGSRAVVVEVEDDVGLPVAGVRVTLTLVDETWLSSETDSSGSRRFTFDGVPASARVAYTTKDPPREFLPAPQQEVTSDQTKVRFVLWRAGFVRGRVLGPDGRPRADAGLNVMDGGRRIHWVQTNDEGRFSARVPLGAPVDLIFRDVAPVVQDGAGLALAGELRAVRAGDEGLVMRLLRVRLERSIDVLVQSPSGEPVPAVSVRAFGENEPTFSWGKSDAAGRVRLSGLPDYEVTISAAIGGESSTKGRGAAPEALPWAPPERLQVVPSGQTVVLAFREAGPIAGVVVDTDGKPVPNCYVAALAGSRRIATSSTDREGAFALLVAADLPSPLRIEARVHTRGESARRASAADVWPRTDNLRLILR